MIDAAQRPPLGSEQILGRPGGSAAASSQFPGGHMSYESTAEPIKVGYLMDFTLPPGFPEEM